MKNVLLLGIGLSVIGLTDAVAGDKPAVSKTQDRFELAKKIYRARILSILNRRVAPPRDGVPSVELHLDIEAAEDLHRWSIRWMEAEHYESGIPELRLAALQAHLERMGSLETGKMVRKELADHPLVKELDERKISVDLDPRLALKENPDNEELRRYVDVTRYFRLEAEAWVILEMEKHSTPRPTLP